MLKTNNLREFIEYLQEQVVNHSVYVRGAQGQLGPAVNERWIRQVETSEATPTERSISGVGSARRASAMCSAPLTARASACTGCRT